MVSDMVDDSEKGGMLTITEASRLLHIHPNTIRRWSKQGLIESYRIGPRGDRRFKLEDINRLLVGKAEDKGSGVSRSIIDSKSTLEIT